MKSIYTSGGAVRGRVWWGMILLLAVTATTAPAAYVLLADGTRVEGTAIRAKLDGEVLLTVEGGQRIFTRGQYVKAVADKPADMDKARQMIAAKQYDAAISLLDTVASQNRFLQWDNFARILQGQAYVLKGSPTMGVEAVEKIFSIQPEVKNDPEIQLEYGKILMSAKQTDKAIAAFNTVISGGNREAAARAQLARGDLRVVQDRLEDAVLDYLRTVLLFDAEKDVQPEALFKAGQALEKLRDPRAKQFYGKLVSEYPSSPFASQVKK